jgi:hypothetical protein
MGGVLETHINDLIFFGVFETHKTCSCLGILYNACFLERVGEACCIRKRLSNFGKRDLATNL